MNFTFNKVFYWGLLINCIYLIISCSSGAQHQNAALQVKDAFDRTIDVPSNPQRVVSLCPSQTECLLEIIDTSQLVAVTTVCNHPANLIAGKPKINSYPPDYEKIIAIKPDLVFSLKGMIKLEEVRKLEELGIKVLVQKADSLNHMAKNFRQLGLIFRREHTGDSLAMVVEKRLMAPTKTSQVRSYVFLFSYDPLYAFGEGNYLNEVFENNGFKNIVTKAKFNVPFPIISREYLVQNEPDVLFASSKNILENLVAKYPEMKNLVVFKSNNIDSINADICSRPTLRLLMIDSLLKQRHKVLPH